MQPKIDPEFKALLAPLTKEEYAGLEESILERGCLDTIKTWNDYIIDGHNRFSICMRHGVLFGTEPLDFDTREDVIEWMIRNQLARRNQTPEQISYFRGKLYEQMKKAEGGNQRPLGNNYPVVSERTSAKVAEQYGVTEKTIRNDADYAKAIDTIAEHAGDDVKQQILSGELPVTKKDVVQLAQMPEEKRKAITEKIATGATMADANRELKEREREERREENRKIIASVPEPSKIIVNAKFATIVIDPPWDWGDEGDQDQFGRARPDYATMSIEEIEQLEVTKMSDVDCHLYLWITNRSLPKGFRLLDAWGFRYITALTWVKPHFGMGNYFRGQTEQILFGIKGSQPLKRKDVGTAFFADRGKGGHSSKPPSFLELVESCSPGPYLEIFSRSERDGWVTWGQNTNE